MNNTELNDLLDRFDGLKILVIGDLMLDGYWWGHVSRISPEAPVPVVSVDSQENRLGGAGNVALNVLELGATPIICSVIGDDETGKIVSRQMKDLGLDTSGLIELRDRKTTSKTRVIGNNHQLIRVDNETEHDLTRDEEELVIKKFKNILKKETPDAIIIQDYNKGMLTASLIGEVLEIAKDKLIPVAVDPKRKNFMAYKGATLFKPNLKELAEGLKMDIDRENDQSLHIAARKIREELGAEIILLTLSDKGILYSSSESGILPAHLRNIADVSGAGDTVISVAALCLAQNASARDIAWLSNIAGGLVCEHVGVVPVDKVELRREAEKTIDVR